MNFIRKAKNLVRNLQFLSNTRFDEITWQQVETMKNAVKYGSLLKTPCNLLKILSPEDSLAIILSNPKSFYRFGDGEINIMSGKDAGTQKFDKRLADLLLTALEDTSSNSHIGIGFEYFTFNLWGHNEFANKFYLLNADNYRKFFLEHCSTEFQYIDTGFTQRYFSLNEMEIQNWYEKLVLLFKNKKINVFMGETAFNNLEYKIYDEAESVKYFFQPSKNAFDKYDEILGLAKTLPKDEILCFALGATAKPLIYELSKEHYICYDIGHMAKDYDSYRKNIAINLENAEKFYTDDYKIK